MTKWICWNMGHVTNHRTLHSIYRLPAPRSYQSTPLDLQQDCVGTLITWSRTMVGTTTDLPLDS